jgi:hypothetical protein
MNPTTQTLISTGVSVAVTSLLVPLLFHYLKRKDDLARRDFDLKYQEFKRYVAALDTVATATRADFDKISREVFAPHFKAILEGRPDLVGLQQALAEFATKVTAPVLIAKQELSGLRLIGSKALVSLIDQYTQAHADIVNSVLAHLAKPNALAQLQEIRPAIEPLGTKSLQLYGQIIAQMRSELGVKK